MARQARRTLLWWLAVPIAALALDACARTPPDKVETYGPFEVVTHYRPYTTGYNEGQVRRELSESYSLRHRGKAYVLELPGDSAGKPARIERFNAAITMGEQPAVIVNVGDPNNDNRFFLVREREGRAEAEPLGPDRGDVGVALIDQPQAGIGSMRTPAIHRAKLPPGRLALIGNACVVDTGTLAVHRFTDPNRWAFDPFLNPLAASPDRGSFVRLASEQQGFVLHVQDFLADQSTVLELPLRRYRLAEREDVNGAWFAHYFEWRRDDGGRDRLVARADAPTLPLRGRFRAGTPGDASDSPGYRLKPVKAELRARLVEFMERELGAKATPGRNGEFDLAYVIGTEPVFVSFHYDEISVFGDSWGTPPTSAETMRRIAEGFDRELATGKYEEFFVE
jgi:hypothetical protein